MKRKQNKAKSIIPIIGFDTEWQNLPDGKRKILSYQYYCLLSEGNSFSKVYYADGQRIPLTWFIHNIMSDGMEQGYFKNYPKTLLMVAHYNVGDLSAFSDFCKLKNLFETVRASFSTFQPVQFNIRIKGNYHKFKVILRDTINLAPQGMHKLEDLGKIIGIEKIDLESKGYSIENMQGLLDENRPLFETYALKDAEISAKYTEMIRKYVHDYSK